MPIFEYRCRACGATFELLVRGSAVPACAACAATDLERLLSVPAIKSDSTHARALGAARARDAAAGAHNARVQREYELSHND